MIMIMSNEAIVTQWVCVDCFVLLVNGDVSPDCPNAADLLTKFEDYRAVPGMSSEEHSCLDDAGDRAEECDCETDTYSTASCDGCGSHLHGERHAVTIYAPLAGVATSTPESGYTSCACRDCMEIAVGGGLCNACEGECGPEFSTSLECQAEGAYGVLEQDMYDCTE